MDEEERSTKEQDQHTQELIQHTDSNGFIKNPKGKFFLPKSYLLKRYKLLTWFLSKPSIREKTAWNWLDLLVAPVIIAVIAGILTSIPFCQQNKILKQGEEAEENRNQQALLIKYLDDISKLVEGKLLTLNDDKSSETQRTIARARTLSVLRALDSDRKGELIQFLSAAQLIEGDKPIIVLNQANLKVANLEGANLWGVNLWNADLENANLEDAILSFARLKRANLENANLEGAILWNANLSYANLEGANLKITRELNPAEVKTACNWEKARFSEDFKQKLDQVLDQKIDCSIWNRD